MTPMQKLRDLPPHVRAPALDVLDSLTRPLTLRELDRAVMDQGYSRSEARLVSRVLKHLKVVAIVGP